MRRKSNKRRSDKGKSKIRNYTAVVPKTIKATRGFGTATVRKMDYFLKNVVSTLRKTAKRLDKRVAKTIGSLTKKRRGCK